MSRGIVLLDECPAGWVATSAGNCALLLTCDTNSRAGFRAPPPTVTAAPHANARPSAPYSRQRRHSRHLVRVARQTGPNGRTVDRTCSWEAAEATCAADGAHLFALEPDHLPTTGGQSQTWKRDTTLSPRTHHSPLPPQSPLLPPVTNPLKQANFARATGAIDRETSRDPSRRPLPPPSDTENEAQMPREDEGVWLAEFLSSSVREHQLAMRPVFIGLGVQFCATSVRDMHIS